jgi:hypothetical protein
MQSDMLRGTDDKELLLIEYPDAVDGATTGITRLKVCNPGAASMTEVRLFAKGIHGTFTAVSSDAEPIRDSAQAVQAQWVQARLLGMDVSLDMVAPDESIAPFKSIGGPYGQTDLGDEEGDNYLPLPDILPAHYAVVEVRVSIPEQALVSGRIVSMYLGISAKEDMS